MRILVTAGPTREMIDPVRFISNRSSGKMGYAVAAAAAERGHEVVLVSGPVSLAPPAGVRVVGAVSALDMLAAVQERIEWCDALVMSAAVADWRPKKCAPDKLHKREMAPVIELERNPDILLTVAPQKGGRTFVGFAAETRDMVESAQRKLAEKSLDMIVANDVTMPDAGFCVDTNRATFIISGGQIRELPLMSKLELAGQIVEWIEKSRG